MLSLRATNLTEYMDATDCDPAQLIRTYQDFALVNTAVSGWSLLYRRFLYPILMQRSGQKVRLLDIGCGGGDVLYRIVRRAKRDGFNLQATGIDPNEQAIAYAKKAVLLSDVNFYATTVEELAQAGESFDIVLSNHVLHHLTDLEVTDMCQISMKMATRLAIHNDIHRHPLAYLMFPFIGGLFPHSLILPDGMRSIRRSFTPAELRQLVPTGWEVHTSLPFRCLLTYHASVQ